MATLRQRAAGRRIARALGRAFRRRRMGMAGRMRRKVYRGALTSNPSPSFTETFKSKDVFQVVAGSPGAGRTFKVRISDIPQSLQYFNLYKQYRINWVKVMMLPKINTENTDPNIYTQMGALAGGPLPSMGMARIVYSIQDSPNTGDPVSEAEVLQENGCKIKAFKSKWSCSFKPVPDVAQQTNVGTIWTRQKFRQWFNFDGALAGNNPEHGGVSVWVTLPGTQIAGDPPVLVPNDYYVYYKVNFSLRDPI